MYHIYLFLMVCANNTCFHSLVMNGGPYSRLHILFKGGNACKVGH
jgi:hypothetical protein